MSVFFSINKKFVKEEEAKIALTDLGLRRGYAAFDFMRLKDGVPLFIEDHMDRFETSIKLMDLELPISRNELKEHVLELIAANNQKTAGIQFYLTAGESTDGVSVAQPNLLILQVPLPKYSKQLYLDGARLISNEFMRDLPEAKSTNYFHALRLAKAIKSAGALDVLFKLNGYIYETSRSNIFFVMPDKTIITAKNNILNGVVRRNILRILPKYFKLEITDVAESVLEHAQEAFITSTVREVMPITFIDNKALANGRVGSTVTKIRQIYSNHVNDYIAKHSKITIS